MQRYQQLRCSLHKYHLPSLSARFPAAAANRIGRGDWISSGGPRPGRHVGAKRRLGRESTSLGRLAVGADSQRTRWALAVGAQEETGPTTVGASFGDGLAARRERSLDGAHTTPVAVHRAAFVAVALPPRGHAVVGALRGVVHVDAIEPAAAGAAHHDLITRRCA